MRTDRLLGILMILAHTPKITAQELADRFEVSKRTIFRDLQVLSQAGLPITAYPGAGGGVAVLEGYTIDEQVLTDKDRVKLFMALQGLYSIDQDASLTELLAKLVPFKEAAVFAQSDRLIDLSSWFSDSLTQEKAQALHQAVCAQKCVRLDYIARSGRAERIIEPHKLVFKQSYWYLYAYCRQREAFRLFRLDRIACYELLEELFQPRPLEEICFADQAQAQETLFTAKEAEGLWEVILAYDPREAFALTDKIDAAFLKEDDQGNGEIRFYTSDLSWTAGELLGLLDKVQILAPPELKAAIQNRLERMIIYQKG